MTRSLLTRLSGRIRFPLPVRGELFGGPPRRLLLFVVLIAALAGMGLWWMVFQWRGEAGAPAVRRLYVPGRFASGEALLTLDTLPRTGSGVRCFWVSGGAGPEAARTACAGGTRLWVDDALLEVSVAEGGTPRVSVAGVRPAEGEWIGSDAGPQGPRFPLRGYGVPARAARMVSCPEETRPLPAGCIQVYDRLGRMALARADGRVPPGGPRLRAGGVYPLGPGDELWLGLIRFRVELHTEAGGRARLALERVGHTRPDSAVRGALGGGGDRRWLGRLWTVESPDPAAALPARFEVLRMSERYTTENLSRQRTNFEAEDLLQRLVDAELLCLDGAPDAPRVAWRPLARPGCARPPVGSVASPSEVSDAYRRARSGDAARAVRLLVERTNTLLAGGTYLDDATLLPLAFGWEMRLRESGARGAHPYQPAPRQLWGVRFDATRVLRNRPGAPPRAMPGAYLRASTSSAVIQVLGVGEEVLGSFHLASRAGAGATPRTGAICLGGALSGATVKLDGGSGSHHPLGSAALGPDPRQGAWSADPAAPCGGCRLAFTERPGGGVELREGPGCVDGLHVGRPAQPGGAYLLRGNDLFAWTGTTPVRFRYLDRGRRAWAAVTDPRTGRRGFLQEFYERGGLAPLLGDSARYGVEAALRGYGAGTEGAPPLELSIDGDLQLAVQSIVDAAAAGLQARPGRTPVTVAVLDARTGELLAAAGGPRRTDRAGRPTAWEAAAGLDGGVPESALLRRGAVGSTLKVAGAYALVNSPGIVRGGPVTALAGVGASERGPGGEARLFLTRARARGEERAVGRKCSGPGRPHVLPVSGAGLTEGTLVERFATSCNSFFIQTGFRHAGAKPLVLSPLSPGQAPGPRELGMRALADSLVLVQSADVPIADRVRDGLAADFAPGWHTAAPHSLYGILARSGFHFHGRSYDAADRAALFTFTGAGGQTRVELADRWFAGGSVPSLVPGRDFVYPTIPSPGRLDERTVQGRGPAATEWFDGTSEAVRRTARDGARADEQFAMLLIGQSSVTASALSLSVLYAPAARPDGRSVAPCLFRAGCGPDRAGPLVLRPDAPSGGEALNRALRAVLEAGGTAGPKLPPARRGDLRGWGGKTGTYDVARAGWPADLGPESDWRSFVAWACGVEGVPAPSGRLVDLLSRVDGGAAVVARSGRGGATGARACEDSGAPLNPGGIHDYRGGPAPPALDSLSGAVHERAARAGTLAGYHALVLAALPRRGAVPEHPSAAAGIVVSVLVDDTADLAVPIAAQTAGAVQRWAELARDPGSVPLPRPGGRR